jgi:hypothetical protein
LFERLGVDVDSVKFGLGATFDGTFPDTATDAWELIDFQEIPPHGTPDQVREHTREVISAMRGLEGGFIAPPSHTVQPDVPAQNLLAMLEYVRQFAC